MYPILLCSVIAVAIFIERFIYLRKTYKDSIDFIARIEDSVKNNLIDEAVYFCEQSGAFVTSHIVKTGLVKYKMKHERHEIKESIIEIANSEIPKLEKYINILGTIVNVAPMLGLLGTVIGMVDSIQVLSQSSASYNTQQLLDGIWVALLTTVFGLIVAIPTLIGHNYLINKVNSIVIFIESKSNELVDVLSTKSINNN